VSASASGHPDVAAALHSCCKLIAMLRSLNLTLQQRDLNLKFAKGQKFTRKTVTAHENFPLHSPQRKNDPTGCTKRVKSYL